METTIRFLIMYAAVALTGLSAGLFYAWSVSVIPGTLKVADATYLQTMQSVNRAILNPAFYTVFFGSLICLSIASIYQFHTNNLVFWLMLGASITYLLGTVGVTGLGNVPLNNQLESLNLSQMEAGSLAGFRKFYETRWNQLHQARTIFAVISFLLAIGALAFHSNQLQPK